MCCHLWRRQCAACPILTDRIDVSPSVTGSVKNRIGSVPSIRAGTYTSPVLKGDQTQVVDDVATSIPPATFSRGRGGETFRLSLHLKGERCGR
jgi:hypothetical protein